MTYVGVIKCSVIKLRERDGRGGDACGRGARNVVRGRRDIESRHGECREESEEDGCDAPHFDGFRRLGGEVGSGAR